MNASIHYCTGSEWKDADIDAMMSRDHKAAFKSNLENEQYGDATDTVKIYESNERRFLVEVAGRKLIICSYLKTDDCGANS